MADKNAVGQRGEAIFILAITSLVGAGKTPYFRATQQGAKWPVTDFYCELEGQTGRAFMIQAKTTQASINSKANLPIATVSKAKIQKLFDSPYPFYFVGIHEPTQQAYIAVPNTCRSISSVPTAHRLGSKATLDLLRAEVETFWNRKTIVRFAPAKSTFSF